MMMIVSKGLTIVLNSEAVGIKCKAKGRNDAGGYEGWSANYVLRWKEGIEWRLFRNLVEMWLANGLEKRTRKKSANG
jgi:hypothetical protein